MERLNAYVFTRSPGFMDGHGPVIIVARNLADAQLYYRNAAREKYRTLLGEFGLYSPSKADNFVTEDLRVMEAKEVPLIPGTIILDEGI